MKATNAVIEMEKDFKKAHHTKEKILTMKINETKDFNSRNLQSTYNIDTDFIEPITIIILNELYSLFHPSDSSATLILILTNFGVYHIENFLNFSQMVLHFTLAQPSGPQ